MEESYESYIKYKLVLQHNVTESFNGVDQYIDISNKVDSVKGLSEGTIAIKFKTSIENKTQTLFSISDKNYSNSYFEVKLLNGKVRLEIYENGINLISYTAIDKNLSDDNWHTIVISNGALGWVLYTDGKKLGEFQAKINKFISKAIANDLSIMNIGRKGTSIGINSYFQGEIEYIEVYDKQFSHEYSAKYSLNDYREILNIIHGKEGNTILFAGDSITHGPLHTKGYRSYSEFLKERLRGENISGKLKSDNFIINTGVSSAQTKDAIEGYETWVATYNPKIVFLTFGMNDCTGTTLDIYKENLTTLVRKVREIGAIPIIQTINTTNDSRENELPLFMDEARVVANELNVFLIDHNMYWKSLGKTITNTWLGDAIHPNEKGHLELAKLIFRELKLDTEDSYTQKLSYPLVGNGTAKPVIDTVTRTYSNYSEIKEKELIGSYKVRELYERNFEEIRNKALQDSVANSWVLIGDSSNSGNGSTYGYKNYGEYFEERIRWELSTSQMITRERYVIDAAIDGADSRSINENFNKWIAEFNPKILSIMIGGNERGTVEEFEVNLREIIQKSKVINALVMLQTPVLQKNDITQYVDIILKVAKELNIPVVNHFNIWNNLQKANPHIKETFLNKDYKLNHRGHLRVAQDMMKAIGIFDSSSISCGALVDMKYEASTKGNELCL